MPKFSRKSKERLAQCDPELQLLFNEVIKHYDCTILEGHRGKQAQDSAHAMGKSQLRYPQSKHNKKPSLAVDAAPWPIDWRDINRFYEFAGFVKCMAIVLNIDITWGGDFKSFFDGPHYELKRRK